MQNENIASLRWVKRLGNYQKTFDSLADAVALAKKRPLSDLEKQGLIQAFEFTHELAWNLMKDYLVYQGVQDITGSRDASREAFSKGLITDGEAWMAMIQSRNKTSHTYNLAVANEIVDAIQTDYVGLFTAFLHRAQQLKDKL